MAFFDDFSVDGSTGAIRHVSGTTRYSVIDMHRAIQDLADNPTSSGDDLIDIQNVNPSTRRTDNDIVLNGSFNIDDASAQYLFGGSITQANGDTVYSGIDLQFLVTPFTADVYILQDGSRVELPVPTGNTVTDSSGFLIKVRDGGTTIDSGDLRFYTRDLGSTYSDLAVNVANGGLTTVFLGPGADPDVNSADGATYASVLADLTITTGAFSFDVNNGNGARDYDIQVAVSNSRSPLEVYQALQYVTRDGSTDTIGAVAGQFYRLAQAGYTPNPAKPLATFAGGNLTGSQGVYFTGFDAQYAQNFIGTDDTNTVQTPPITSPITVTNTIAGDRILVAREDPVTTGEIYFGEYTIAPGNIAGNGTLVINETIDSDKPDNGTVRAENPATGVFEPYEYSSFSGSTFTLTGTLNDTLTAGDNAYVPLLDETATGTSVSTSILYGGDVDVVGTVRNATDQIVPFPISGTVTTSGFSVNTIRQADA